MSFKPYVSTQLGLAQLGLDQLGNAVNVGYSGIPTITATAILPSRVAFGSGTVEYPPQVIASTTVLPTRVAFGSGSLAVFISSMYVIPSRVAFGTGALLLQTYISIFLQGLDISTKVFVGSVQITNALSQPTTACFAMFDLTSTIVPQVGQNVQIYLAGVCIFAGQVTQPFQTGYQAFPGYLYQGSGTGSTGGVGSATQSSGSGSTGSGGVQCTDYTNLLNRFYIGVYFDGNSIYPAPTFLSSMVAYIVETYLAQDGFTYDDSDGDPGINLGPTTFNWVTATSAFNTLSTATGWEWSVDYFKVIRFYASTGGTTAAPYNIADNDGNVFAESLGVEFFQQMYRNVQGVLSPNSTSELWSDTYSTAIPGPFPNNPQPPDGIRRAFLQTYGFTAIPIVTVNGVAQTVILLSQVPTTPSGSWQWYIVDPASGLPSYGLWQNGSDPALTSADTLVISYSIPIAGIYWVQDDAQIAARRAIEGGSGIYESVDPGPSAADPNAIAAYAAGLLARYGADGIPFQVSYSTRNPKPLIAGMTQQIQCSNPPLNFTGLITQVTWQDVDGTYMQLSVTIASGLYQGNFNFSQFMAALIAQASTAQSPSYSNYQILIAPSYPGITNPGVTGGNYVGTIIIQQAVELAYSFSVFLPNAVTGSQMTFALLNESQGLQQIATLTFQVGQRGTQTTYVPATSPFPCYQNDVIEILVGGTGGAIFDAVCTFVTAIPVL